jgi:hypothetical protein
MLVENRDAWDLGLKGGGDGHRPSSLDHRGGMFGETPPTRTLKFGVQTGNYRRDIWTLTAALTAVLQIRAFRLPHVVPYRTRYRPAPP